MVHHQMNNFKMKLKPPNYTEILNGKRPIRKIQTLLQWTISTLTVSP